MYRIRQAITSVIDNSYLKTVVITASKSLQSAGQAFFAIQAGFAKFIPKAPTSIKRGIGSTSAAITSIFYFLAYGPAILQSYIKPQELDQIKSSHGQQSYKNVARVAAFATLLIGWYAVTALLPDALWATFVAIIPALINLKAFSAYKLNKAWKNINKFIDKRNDGEVDKKAIYYTLFTSGLGAIAISCFSFFILDHAFLKILNYFFDLNIVTSIISFTCAGIPSLAIMMVDLGSRCLEVFHYYQDGDELVEVYQQKHSTARILALIPSTPASSYELGSTWAGYFIASIHTLNRLQLSDASLGLRIVNYSLSSLFATSGTYNDLIFYCRPALKNYFALLPDKSKEMQRLTLPINNEQQNALLEQTTEKNMLIISCCK